MRKNHVYLLILSLTYFFSCDRLGHPPSTFQENYTISIISCLIALCGIFLYLIYYIRRNKLLAKRLEESESLIRKKEQIIQELSILKENLQQDICAYKDSQKQLARTNERLKNLSCAKEYLEQELEVLKKESLILNKRKKESENLLGQFESTQLYHNFHAPTNWEPTKEDWETLFCTIEKIHPNFAVAMRQSISLSESEKKICYLSKIKVKPGVIGILLHLENVSIYRKRLYEKLNEERGTAKNFDTYISNL